VNATSVVAKSSAPWPDKAAWFDHYDKHLGSLPMDSAPILGHESVQLGKGDGVTLAATVCTRDLVIQRVATAPKMIARSLLDPEWVAISVGLRWDGVRIYNGVRARPFDVFLTASPSGYETSGAGRDIVTIGIRRKRLHATCVALLGLGEDNLELRDLAFNMGSKPGKAFQNTLVGALLSDPSPKSEMPVALQPMQANDLIDIISRNIAPHLVTRSQNTTSKLSQRAVVRRALEVFADRTYSPSISELCHAAGVGETYLYQSFVSILDVTPARFIRMRRLSEARRRFLDSDAPPRSVKDVALSLGFAESGRFSQYYRATFGEYPSQTLERHAYPF
jgi:AraC-like DNA-binding protein